MHFALGMPGLILYPAIASEWEARASAAQILGVARKADDAGWHWLTVSEHAVIPRARVALMGSPFPEAISACSVLAGATRRIRLLPYVLVVPYRHPVLLAKQIATLDFLSGGRVAVGAAAGHLEAEFEVLGVPFAERGRATDESLAAMIELWTSDAPHFYGERVRFSDVAFEPKPVQRPYPPIFVGGSSRAAMRRAARLGDGWMPWRLAHDELPVRLAQLREQPGFAPRRGRFEVVMSVADTGATAGRPGGTGLALRARRDELVDAIGALERAGVTIAQLPPPRTSSVEELLEWIEWFASEILPRFPG
jgi:probable F420-dependent oxidoreductase